jgi:acetyl-CoA synthetase
VGAPNTIRTEIVKVFIVLRSSQAPTSELAREIQEFVKSRLAANECPCEVAFAEDLPITTVSKIMCWVLRQRD